MDGTFDIDWGARREQMVEKQLVRRGINDPRVLAAMRELPRELFVPASRRLFSYNDEPISIGHGQTISQPYITALMAQCLELKGSEKVLEVGAGCGYHAALLGRLTAEVIAMEILPDLAAMARENIAAAGLQNVRVVCGDGSLGYPDAMPFDCISVAAAAPEIPPALLDQLADPGRLVVPVGSLSEQTLLLVTRSEGRITQRAAAYCRFVPLLGGKGWVLNEHTR